ncbi:acetyl-CoA C-acyltransferase [Lachancea thermotolerans CBS 6340]|uniref:acetyl-CoA C-acyltransferase n=1 Tax=Lachancea thermotolerans (strain ATCC 56472 / CBS 6340 / NRRL Y-8284) TaxID=559295 RepID=C5DH19_LACTC|nr:KLTH0E00682p [Lachancea thermotolerans CBS 6340]CAR23080.1 KLTH0E00682p [Lachancea thermotolerans CBS 6340]
MSERLTQIKDHLISAVSPSVQDQRADDVVIIAAHRSPIARGFKGGFKDVNSDYLVHQFLQEFFKKVPSSLSENKQLIEEVACGNVLNPGAGATEHRAACLAAGIPFSTPFVALNRQCSSGLVAVNDIANKIKVGQIGIGLALGAESMSKNYGPKALGNVSAEMKQNKDAKKCMVPMGITNENVSHKFHVSRQSQDTFAAESHRKAERAISEGLFEDEILPINLPDGTTISTDEGPRKGVTADNLAQLKPAFIPEKGTTTAGNASQISDGVAAVLLARRSIAESMELPILGKYVACQVIGVPPEIMGVGPAYAIPKVLKDCGLAIEKVDVFEINEAFAGQALYCINKLQIPLAKVNPRGGAIALGHPLGCTGARQVATLLRELERGQVGIVSMCVGTGMGAAAVFVRE